jgi:hypothetical protein
MKNLLAGILFVFVAGIGVMMSGLMRAGYTATSDVANVAVVFSAFATIAGVAMGILMIAVLLITFAAGNSDTRNGAKKRFLSMWRW